MAASYVIDFALGSSFGEPQPQKKFRNSIETSRFYAEECVTKITWRIHEHG